MRRFAAPLLGALLVWAGVPMSGTAAAGAHGADCRMACCKKAGAGAARGAHPEAGMSAGARAGMKMETPGRTASSSQPSAPSCRVGCGRAQQAGLVDLVESMPSLLAAPPRLPAPAGAFFAADRPDFARILRPLDLPERPPRTA